MQRLNQPAEVESIMNRRRFAFLALGAALFPAARELVAPALAKGRVDKPAEQLANGEFNWFPERSPTGPIVIIVSIPDQLVHVYRNGIRIAASTCSTGKPGHGTPTGVFKILEKDKDHRSSTYNNAPMPNMNRLTWDGIALHAGNLPGYPASHGCVRLPLEFSEYLFTVTARGMTVVIADNVSQPASVAHPGMVLGDYARAEFAAVDRSIKQHQYSIGRTAAPKSTSVVVTWRDRRIAVWENDRIVAMGKVEIVDPQRPLGDHTYVLTEVDGRSDTLTWVSADYAPGGNNAGDQETLLRIRAYPKVRRAIEKRMHQGMTLVTSDGTSSSRTMRRGGFTIFSAGG